MCVLCTGVPGYIAVTLYVLYIIMCVSYAQKSLVILLSLDMYCTLLCVCPMHRSPWLYCCHSICTVHYYVCVLCTGVPGYIAVTLYCTLLCVCPMHRSPWLYCCHSILYIIMCVSYAQESLVILLSLYTVHYYVCVLCTGVPGYIAVTCTLLCVCPVHRSPWLYCCHSICTVHYYVCVLYTGVPGSKVNFLRFVQTAKTMREEMSSPTIIHCRYVRLNVTRGGRARARARAGCDRSEGRRTMSISRSLTHCVNIHAVVGRGGRVS